MSFVGAREETICFIITKNDIITRLMNLGFENEAAEENLINSV